jgi:hypothetical protein
LELLLGSTRIIPALGFTIRLLYIHTYIHRVQSAGWLDVDFTVGSFLRKRCFIPRTILPRGRYR